MHRSHRVLLLLGTGLVTCLCLTPTSLRAQLASLTTPSKGSKSAPLAKDQPVAFNADHVEYDREHNQVVATGNVQAWQNDYVLRADKVVFDRATNVVSASGNVALVQPDGQTLFSDYAELTSGMRDGVMRGLSATLAENAKLVANGARRTDGELNELSKAIYSTCNLCADDPSAAPLWQLRAGSLLQDHENQRIEYRDVWLDLYGVPAFYMPWFSHADPSVKRESGFMVPSIGKSKHLGAFGSIPYYLVLDPQSDVMITPTFASKTLPNLDLNYRRRFNNGTLSVNLSVGYNQGTSYDSYLGRTSPGFQGALFAKGQFSYDEEWRYGFDVERASSRDYLRDYRLGVPSDVLTSQLYVEGFGEGSYARMDTRAYQGLTDSISQSYLPYVLPYYQYHYTGEPDALGGRLSVGANAFNVYREIGTRTQRVAATAEYVRPFSGDMGEQYNVTVHIDAAAYNATMLNEQPNFSSSSSSGLVRAQPQVALNYRWPFMRSDDTTGTQVIEPIAQVIFAPNVGNHRNGLVPNEDSMDLEFSDANLFAFNRYPGIDRFEGGTRVNYALHASWDMNGKTLDGLIGESYQFHKDDTFPVGSGLDSNASDIVARVTFTPVNWLDMTYRTRLDHTTFGTHMADGVVSFGVPLFRITTGYTYENVSPYYLYDQPAVPSQYYTPRNEVTVGASSQFRNYKVSGYARKDIKNDQLVAMGASGSYEDECFILSANLYRRYTSIDGDHGDTTILFQITFKTVGQVGTHAF